MRYYRGNSLAQYGIIIGLIAIGLVPVFIFMGNQILDNFSNFTNMFIENNEVIANNPTTKNLADTKNTVKPTPENPQVNCVGSDCAIDFGDYVLKGIPADFSTYVNTTGASGGTEQLATVLTEVAENANLDQTTKDLITELANSGHMLASAQNSVESIAKNDVPLSAWVSGMYSQIQKGNGGPYDQFLAKKAAVETLLEGASSTDQKNIKEIINILSLEVTSLNEEFITKCDSVSSLASSGAYETGVTLIKDVAGLDRISTTTDLDSAIICKTGSGEDKDNTCN